MPVLASQLSVVHGLLSLQVTGVPPAHWPAVLHFSAFATVVRSGDLDS
ncbi:MAG: hypothetical protein FJ100_20890 [Deltaproteobacteria bacterium]|nr:hypothetical protein [Deltaproteobacteria bacterium]